MLTALELCGMSKIIIKNVFDQLAGSDVNKSIIVEKEGMDKLVTLSSRFSDDPLVLQEVSTFGAEK